HGAGEGTGGGGPAAAGRAGGRRAARAPHQPRAVVGGHQPGCPGADGPPLPGQSRAHAGLTRHPNLFYATPVLTTPSTGDTSPTALPETAPGRRNRGCSAARWEALVTGTGFARERVNA